MTTLAEVRLWGRTIGAVSLEDGTEVAAFQYTPEFAASGIPIGDTSIPLAANSGVYWNAATSAPSSSDTAPMVRPQSLTSANVVTAYPPTATCRS